MFIVRTLKEDDKITEEQYKYLHPTAENVPRMYCAQPKIHKPDNPLRHIVDYTGSIGYNGEAPPFCLSPARSSARLVIRDWQRLLMSISGKNKRAFDQDDFVRITSSH